MTNFSIRPGQSADIPELLSIWRRSAGATHTFLSDDDIAFYLPLVREALASLELWVGECGGVLAGFLVMDGDMVEALFIDPPYIGKGLGGKFIGHALATRAPGCGLRVDANEQNPNAVAFYLSRGFREIGRSPTDKSGRPFPLVHLVLDGASGDTAQ